MTSVSSFALRYDRQRLQPILRIKKGPTCRSILTDVAFLLDLPYCARLSGDVRDGCASFESDSKVAQAHAKDLYGIEYQSARRRTV